MKIVDTNVHIEKEPISIRVTDAEEFGGVADTPITHYATVDDLLACMKTHDIEKAFVMPNTVTTDKVHSKKSCEMVSRTIKGYKNLIGVACVHPYSKDVLYDFEEAIFEQTLQVLMLAPDRQGFELSDEPVWRLFERVEEMKIPVILHTQWSKDENTYFEMETLYDLATSFQINFILTHLGSGDDLSQLSELTEAKNVYFETSHVRQRLIYRAAEMFGTERLLYGSDFAYNLYPKHELDKILNLELNKKDIERIMGKNAEKLL